MEIIRQYTDKIVEGDFVAPEGVCDNWHLKPDEHRLHECRKMQVRFSVGTVVEIVTIFFTALEMFAVLHDEGWISGESPVVQPLCVTRDIPLSGKIRFLSDTVFDKILIDILQNFSNII